MSADDEKTWDPDREDPAGALAREMKRHNDLLEKQQRREREREEEYKRQAAEGVGPFVATAPPPRLTAKVVAALAEEAWDAMNFDAETLVCTAPDDVVTAAFQAVLQAAIQDWHVEAAAGGAGAAVEAPCGGKIPSQTPPLEGEKTHPEESSLAEPGDEVPPEGQGGPQAPLGAAPQAPGDAELPPDPPRPLEPF